MAVPKVDLPAQSTRKRKPDTASDPEIPSCKLVRRCSRRAKVQVSEKSTVPVEPKRNVTQDNSVEEKNVLSHAAKIIEIKEASHGIVEINVLKEQANLATGAPGVPEEEVLGLSSVFEVNIDQQELPDIVQEVEHLPTQDERISCTLFGAPMSPSKDFGGKLIFGKEVCNTLTENAHLETVAETDIQPVPDNYVIVEIGHCDADKLLLNDVFMEMPAQTAPISAHLKEVDPVPVEKSVVAEESSGLTGDAAMNCNHSEIANKVVCEEDAVKTQEGQVDLVDPNISQGKASPSENDDFTKEVSDIGPENVSMANASESSESHSEVEEDQLHSDLDVPPVGACCKHKEDNEKLLKEIDDLKAEKEKWQSAAAELKKEKKRLKKLRTDDAFTMQEAARELKDSREGLRKAIKGIDRFIEGKRQHDKKQKSVLFGSYAVPVKLLQALYNLHGNTPTTYFPRLCEVVAGREYCMSHTLMGYAKKGGKQERAFEEDLRTDLITFALEKCKGVKAADLKKAFGTFRSKQWKRELQNGEDFVTESLIPDE